MATLVIGQEGALHRVDSNLIEVPRGQAMAAADGYMPQRPSITAAIRFFSFSLVQCTAK
jgi:hypothetical protein